MADYKEKIKQTIDQLGEKAKSAAESSNIKDLYNKSAEKARDLSKIASGTMDRVASKDELGKTYLELGKLYYEDNQENYASIYASSFQKVENILKRIDELENELEGLKTDKTVNEKTSQKPVAEISQQGSDDE